MVVRTCDALDSSLGRFHSPIPTRRFARIAARMDAAELLDLHKRNQDRPQFYRQYRDAFAAHLSDTTVEAMPEGEASTYEWRQWLKDRKGTITTQLKAEAGESGKADTDERGGNE